jgi:hydrogenase maturation protein HypF
MICARSIRVRGVVQGVGFRPFVYRLASANRLAGWVRNDDQGVEVFLEGAEPGIEAFLGGLKQNPPPAASISAIEVERAEPAGLRDFTIRESGGRHRPTTRISPDLAICADCLRELFDPADRRYRYPYINCTNCGPRYTIVLGLPYDRPNTTMRLWPMDRFCASEYHDPANRRFHAQPVACPACGPHYRLETGNEAIQGNAESIRQAVRLIREGSIVAVKGLGGYHLACDARNPVAVRALRQRKFRKEKPFALMAGDLAAARAVVSLSGEAETLLLSAARPIVLAPARVALEEVAPDNDELGIMLPYTPLHHLLFEAGAPDVLVMTSANRSDEPIAYEDADARERLAGIADAFLIGERPIARRVDDSIVRDGVFGPLILRRARGYAPAAVTNIPSGRPILAVGADLKNTVTLCVDGQAFVSQHIGDLEHYPAHTAFERTIRDLTAMYGVDVDGLLVVHDCHPGYASSAHAAGMAAAEIRAVQHHRAHVASVLAEREAWDRRAIGVSCDGTGYGDDGSIWGGEIFAGSIAEGFTRVAHLRRAALAGGDAAARFPVQAAAGFLAQLDDVPDLAAPPFGFTARYQTSLELVRKGVRSFPTTSTGRLFDTAAAIAGFTREMSFEGQAAMWLQHLAHECEEAGAHPFPFTGEELDFRPLLATMLRDRLRGRPCAEIARAFHRGVATGISQAVLQLAGTLAIDTVVFSGGVFQNELLLRDIHALLSEARLTVWVNHAVPPNDGGISLGQAALGAFGRFDR